MVDPGRSVRMETPGSSLNSAGPRARHVRTIDERLIEDLVRPCVEDKKGSR